MFWDGIERGSLQVSRQTAILEEVRVKTQFRLISGSLMPGGLLPVYLNTIYFEGKFPGIQSPVPKEA